MIFPRADERRRTQNGAHVVLATMLTPLSEEGLRLVELEMSEISARVAQEQGVGSDRWWRSTKKGFLNEKQK